MGARACLIGGTLIAGLAVAAGTFGAHGLPDILRDLHGLTVESNAVDFARAEKNFETSARYQMYHGLALLLVGVLLERRNSSALRIAGASFLFGVLVFCGFMYALVLSQQRWLGAIVPIGGTAFLVGWIALLFGVVRRDVAALAGSDG